MEEKSIQSANNNQSDELIDLYGIILELWNKRKFILKITFAFILFGVFIAFTSKVEYEASCKVMPESEELQSPNLAGLGGLAGLAGINLDMGTSTVLNPDIYPQIITSAPFIINLLNHPINFISEDTVLTPYDYFTEVYNPSIWEILYKYTFQISYYAKKLIFGVPETITLDQSDPNKSIITISKEDMEILNKIKDRIQIEVETETGVITITSEMPDRLAAAQMTDMSLTILKNYIIDYKVRKAQQNLDFITERYNEAKMNYLHAQEKLARYNDSNMNFATSLAKTNLQLLQNEYNLTYEVYKSLAQQMEQMQIEVKKQTPVFTLLEPIKIPIEKSSPERKIIFVLSAFTGFFVAILYIFIKKQIDLIRDRINLTQK